MTEMRPSRWLIWTGPLFAVVFVVVGFFLDGDTPGEKASAAKVVTYYNDHQGQLMAEVFLSPVVAALLILFACEVRTRARANGASGAGPTVLVAGAIVWASGLLLGASFTLAVVSSSDHHKNQAAETLNVLSNADWVPFIGGIAIFLIGAGMTTLRSGLLPSWLGWAALVVGVISLAGPGGFIGFFGGPLWILIAGILLATRSRSAVGAAT